MRDNGPNSINPFDAFEKRWDDATKKLLENPMPAEQINKIYDLFQKDLTLTYRFCSLGRFELKGSKEFDRLSDVVLYMSIASLISLSKWKDKHPGFIENLSQNLNFKNIINLEFPLK